MANALDVSKYLLSLQDEEAGDTISNLKLQKLLYYAQGFYLAERGRPLFDARVEAWALGPVVPDVYHAFKEFGANALPSNMEYTGIDQNTAEFLDEIYRVYGQFSGWKLSKMTHEETPWKDALTTGGLISHDALKTYFRARLATE